MLNFAPDFDPRRVVREMNASSFLNPVCDHLLVQFVRSKAMFSRLLTQHQYDRDLDENGAQKRSTRYVVQLNEAGAFFLHNLVCCLLGDHRDPAIYFDSAFSATLTMIEPNEELSILQMVNHLEREHPALYARIPQAYNTWQPPERFGEGADAIRRLFYRYVGTNITDISAISISLVLRFILGHEIGHYVREKNARLRESLEEAMDKLVPGLIQNDEELFSDMVGAFHSFDVQHALKQPFQAQLVVLAVILSFMDAYAVTDPRSGRSTLSGPRFSLLIEHFESLGGEYTKAAEELMLMRGDLDAIFWPSLAVARKLVDELGAAAERNRKMPTWYLRSSDYIVRKNVIEE
jgi:hypothetical protein